MGNILYVAGRCVFLFIFRVIFKTEIQGRDRVPLDGPLLIVSNHASFADPPLLGVALPRKIEFMTMIELFRNPLLRVFVRALGCIPVDRTRVDQRAAREAVRRLRAGHCVGLFPEGGIRTGPNSVLGGNPLLHPGGETIALLSGAAILPVILRDSRRPYDWRNWFFRKSMRVTFGCPFCLWEPPGLRDRNQLMALVRKELLKTVALD